MCATQANVYRVLIVEDTPEMADLMQEILLRLGIEAAHVPDGPAALEYLLSNPPDLLLLDIGLPGMSGWQVLEAIKTQCPGAAYPVIVLTAFGDPANKLIGKLHDQVAHYITKPFQPRELSSVVRDLLQLSVD